MPFFLTLKAFQISSNYCSLHRHFKEFSLDEVKGNKYTWCFYISVIYLFYHSKVTVHAFKVIP